MIRDFTDHFLDVICIGYIQFNTQRPIAFLFNLLNNFLCKRSKYISNDHISPASDKASAMILPRPRAPPVIIATFPDKLKSSLGFI